VTFAFRYAALQLITPPPPPCRFFTDSLFLIEARDTCILSLCRVASPPTSRLPLSVRGSAAELSAKQVCCPRSWLSQVTLFRLLLAACLCGPHCFFIPHVVQVALFEALLSVSYCHGGTLGVVWHDVLEALEHLDHALRVKSHASPAIDEFSNFATEDGKPRSFVRRGAGLSESSAGASAPSAATAASASMLALQRDPPPGFASTGLEPSIGGAKKGASLAVPLPSLIAGSSRVVVCDDSSILSAALRRLFDEFSRTFRGDGLVSLSSALGALSLTSLAAAATSVPAAGYEGATPSDGANGVVALPAASFSFPYFSRALSDLPLPLHPLASRRRAFCHCSARFTRTR
jgi:hypothetical protein